ncbi:putative casein kinase [Tritrichomonas foetus]|uniref:non-specific serine/threonine protein kinase n=1 Tax=Tritrichomonas foetus TaxID=1144522 RepID=A0A1J4K7E7_9EUKA|nr:putative casein kinase [Tritrichomonas foetus]|eukprot:OHT06808.1 putative casein kinase [Tritrichomonas foetus]
MKQTKINNFDVIDTYRVIKTIANGGFGIVYFVRELGSNQPLVMKIERENVHKSSIEIEYSVLKQIQGSLYFPRLFGTGKLNELTFIVMEMLGPSLSRIKQYLPGNRFSLSTSLRLGIEMVCMLREFHARGFVHRDIKPANFLIRPESPSPICLIDFGLSKRFIDPLTGMPHQKQLSMSCFIGTARYASINAHKHIDLGPRDDMICWFNTMAEMILGELPWSNLNDKNEILKMKEEIEPKNRCKNLPIQFISIYDEIVKTEYDEFPDYDMILLFLSDALRTTTNKDSEPFDWEKLNEHLLEELFPPSVTRRISVGDTLDTLQPRNFSQVDRTQGVKVEQFQLLGDPEEGPVKTNKFCGCCNIE